MIKNYQTTSGRKIISTKFYNNLSDLGINLNMRLKDKEVVNIKNIIELRKYLLMRNI